MTIVMICSAIDIYWSIKIGKALQEVEENPVGKFLISMDDGDPALFMSIKFLGNIAVVLAVIALYQRRRVIAVYVSAALALFQLMLILYLYGVICFSPTFGV
jgi:hypothetical protein